MKTIQIQGKPHIACKWVMIPTNEEPNPGDLLLRHIWKDDPSLECKSVWQYKETVVIGDVKQYITMNGSFRDWYKAFEPQHLYLLADKVMIHVSQIASESLYEFTKRFNDKKLGDEVYVECFVTHETNGDKFLALRSDKDIVVTFTK